MAYNLFGKIAFDSWNCGSYHDSHHAMYVAEVVAAMAADYPQQRCIFLTQVALLHDIEPRHLGTAPEVYRTLDWMTEHKQTLCGILEWSEPAFKAALAMVARTELPFNDMPRWVDSVYDGHSPYSLYQRLLLELEPDHRDEVFEDAQLLSFADQCANFCRDSQTASQSLLDLAREQQKAGAAVASPAVAVLESQGLSARWDFRMVRELGLRGRVLGFDELFRSLPYAMRASLLRHRELYRLEREARQLSQTG